MQAATTGLPPGDDDLIAQPAQDLDAGLDGPRLGGAGDAAKEEPDAATARLTPDRNRGDAGQACQLLGQPVQGTDRWPARESAPGHQACQADPTVELGRRPGQGGRARTGQQRKPGLVQAPTPSGPALPMRRPGIIHQAGEGHQRGAGLLAGQALQTSIQMLTECGGVIQFPLRPSLDQGNTSAGGLGFLACQAIGRAMWQTEAAADATVGDRGQISGGGDGIQGWGSGGLENGMVSGQTPAESGIFWGVASLSHKSVTRDWEPNSDSDLPGGGG